MSPGTAAWSRPSGAGCRDGGSRCAPSEDAPHSSKPGRRKGVRGRLTGRTKGGPNSKLYVLTDAKGRPIRMFLSEGQILDHLGARILLPSIPPAGALQADRRYDADWCRNALIELVISSCIPPRFGRKVQTQGPDRRQAGTLPPVPQDREHGCVPQGLAQDRDALRPRPDPVPLGLCSRGHRHLRSMDLDRWCHVLDAMPF
jgi:hypothetical protein